MADGTSSRIDALREGDAIVAATADGALVIDTVSLPSIAKPEEQATFLTLTTNARTLTLTREHHLPVGPVCCTTLKKAKDVDVGETVWLLQAGTVTASTVGEKGVAIGLGLHSPVLTGGSFPLVGGARFGFSVSVRAAGSIPVTTPRATRMFSYASALSIGRSTTFTTDRRRVTRSTSRTAFTASVAATRTTSSSGARRQSSSAAHAPATPAPTTTRATRAADPGASTRR